MTSASISAKVPWSIGTESAILKANLPGDDVLLAKRPIHMNSDRTDVLAQVRQVHLTVHTGPAIIIRIDDYAVSNLQMRYNVFTISPSQ